jgi:Fe-S-cluster containining protein
VGAAVHCRCYDQRPAVCRRVTAGDTMCKAARFHFELPGGELKDEFMQDLMAPYLRRIRR